MMPNRDRSFRVLLWSLAVFGLAADQATKYGVFAWLSPADGGQLKTYSVFHAGEGGGFDVVAQFEPGEDGGWKRSEDGALVPHVNHGALFGFLRDHKALANGGFAVVSLAAALAIAWWSTQRNTARDPWLCAALGLILAGTLGNFYDRIRFGGVRDFLHWHYLFDWPVFNVADCCLVVGAGLLLLQAFTPQVVAAKGKDAPEAPAPRQTAAETRVVAG
jgi:lipoprotein signal peptidase